MDFTEYDALYRAGRDAAVPISNRQSSPPLSPPPRQKIPVVIAAIVVVAAGVAIGVAFGAANTVRVLKAPPGTHSIARLVGAWSDSVSERTVPNAAAAAIAEKIPATHSAPI